MKKLTYTLIAAAFCASVFAANYTSEWTSAEIDSAIADATGSVQVVSDNYSTVSNNAMSAVQDGVNAGAVSIITTTGNLALNPDDALTFQSSDNKVISLETNTMDFNGCDIADLGTPTDISGVGNVAYNNALYLYEAGTTNYTLIAAAIAAGGGGAGTVTNVIVDGSTGTVANLMVDLSDHFGSAATLSSNDVAAVITNEYTVTTPAAGYSRTFAPRSSTTNAMIMRGSSANFTFAQIPSALDESVYVYCYEAALAGEWAIYEWPYGATGVVINIEWDPADTGSSTTNGTRVQCYPWYRESATDWGSHSADWDEILNATNGYYTMTIDLSEGDGPNAEAAADNAFRVSFANGTASINGVEEYQSAFVTGIFAITPPPDVDDFVATWAIDAGATEQ